MAADPSTRAPQANWGAVEGVPIVQSISVANPVACVVFDDVEVPLGLTSLGDFRKWATSDCFPERGRIDYLAGRIEVDMSPENLYAHGALKTEMATVMNLRIKRLRLGRLFIDRTRVTTPAADLSVEPDIVFVSHESIAERRVVPVPYADNEPDQFIEFEGVPDLVVEIVSKSSVAKDTTRLPRLYWQAGVNEFWLADARRDKLLFQIYHHGQNGYEPASTDPDGFQWSEVTDCGYRLDRYREEDGYWAYSLVEREKSK